MCLVIPEISQDKEQMIMRKKKRYKLSKINYSSFHSKINNSME